MTIDHIDHVLDRIPALAGRNRVIEPLPGGLTNENFKVTTEDGVFVARCNRSDSTLLGIDRDAEFHNTMAAEAAGVGAPFVDYRPDLGVLVIKFLEGRTYQDDDLRAPGALTRLIATLQSLHGGRRFVGDFDMFSRQANYLRTCRERGFAIPDDYERWSHEFARIGRALAVIPEETVPCHNDLLAANVVDDGDRLWLIDYEYSGNGDPYFDLGNTWTECGLDDDHLAEMVRAYAGRDDPQLLARARLNATVSRYGWALWGYIQDASLDDPFDFRGWGSERFELAAADFSRTDFSTLLDQCAGRP